MIKPRIILILGDQLSSSVSSLQAGDKSRDVILMCEVSDETTYVPHHKKKIAFILSAMRHFAERLKADGWTVDYIRLNDPENSGSFTGELSRAVVRHKSETVIVTHPGEWRVLKSLQGWANQSECDLEWKEDTRFVSTLTEFRNWAKGRKALRMEYFYREMRVKTGLLMKDDVPEGGKWNYDSENRKPASASLSVPEHLKFSHDDITREVLQLVEDTFPGHFGRLDNFWFAVTSVDADRARDHFVENALSCFGDYQDAMLEDHKFLYHSLLSFYINAGLLDPLETCKRVEAAYARGEVPLNAAEGFIRQIIGWREYLRGIYWTSGSDYVEQNKLNAKRDLPEFYWSADTKMACIKAVVSQTRDEAYAHHIQRLMITGTFALIAGIEPYQVHEWYLAVYADAFEWVEAPNVIGMALFADGGKLSSKPYAASGSYINKMSDYCQNCSYVVTKKTGENACPFNSLYWHFLDRNRPQLNSNHRLARPYATWDKMSDEKRSDYLTTAESYLKNLNGI